MTTQKLYSFTIFGYKKADMSEKDYHEYISNTHAGHLKALLAKNDIVSYTMVHTPTHPPPLPPPSSQIIPGKLTRVERHSNTTPQT